MSTARPRGGWLCPDCGNAARFDHRGCDVLGTVRATPPGHTSPLAGEVDLIEKTAIRVGMKSLMNHGAASCVYSEGCHGVSQAHLIAFAREVALHCVAALSRPAALQYAGPWCCEQGQAAGKPVCDECAAESAGYSMAMLPDITDDTPLETGEGDARG